jgi:hypothetical protein
VNQQELDLQLTELAAKYIHDPLGFVKACFPWGSGALEGYSGPDAWQASYLTTLGEEVKQRRFDGRKAVLPVRMATASGRGIGKTTLVAWLVIWILCTRPRCQGTVTADSWQQLRDRTWSTIQHWLKLSLFRSWFVPTSDRIHFRSAKESWFVSAQSSKPENAQNFSGQHSAGSTSFVVVDEASGVADEIFSFCEGSLSDGEGMIFLFGNPHRTEGAFHRAVFGSERHRWIHASIDSRRCSFPNKTQIEEWGEAWGEDSDWFRINVKGECPRIGATELISREVVDSCRHFKCRDYEGLPKIMSCDPARFGSASTVIGLRQGRRFVILARYRNQDTSQTARRLMEFMDQHKPDKVVIDADGLGVGVIDPIRSAGFGKTLFDFHGGQRAERPQAYYNFRAECWFRLKDWLGAGAEIPDDLELAQDLCGPRYSYSAKSQIQLERKEDMQLRGLASPDAGDALAMSFAIEVSPNREPAPVPQFLVWPGQQQQQRWMQ